MNSQDEKVVNHIGLGIGMPIGLFRALAALVAATLVSPSDAFSTEVCRLDLEIGAIVLFMIVTWLCGVAIGARLQFGAAPASTSPSTSGASSAMPVGKSKAKSKATSRASSSTTGGDNGYGGSSSGGPPDHAPPVPDHLVLAPTRALQPELLVTQFGERYHLRVSCPGLRTARVVLGPYTACLIFAGGP